MTEAYDAPGGEYNRRHLLIQLSSTGHVARQQRGSSATLESYRTDFTFVLKKSLALYPGRRSLSFRRESPAFHFQGTPVGRRLLARQATFTRSCVFFSRDFPLAEREPAHNLPSTRPRKRLFFIGKATKVLKGSCVANIMKEKGL